MMYSFMITIFLYFIFKIDKLHKKNADLIQSYDKKLEEIEYSFELSLENMNKYIMKTVPKDEYAKHKDFTREIFNLNDRFTMIQRDLETFKKNQIEFVGPLPDGIPQPAAPVFSFIFLLALKRPNQVVGNSFIPACSRISFL